MFNNNFGMNLKEIRKRHHLTQQDVAKKIHVSRKTISSWETGRNLPDIKMVSALANFYATSVDELLGTEHCNYGKSKPVRSVFTIIALTILITGRLTFLMTNSAIIAMDILIFCVFGLLVLDRKTVLKKTKLIGLLMCICFSLSMGLFDAFSLGFSLRLICIISAVMLFFKLILYLKLIESIKSNI
ncbi:transcriptional regulator [Liquorilactobacillus sucicola DSM 21376 = JCM 15457]|nr:helix-turn-helix transcriptional regulator [Liquorilactobacillus sucicola]GAJ25674.1 transcriptional regulator [Liquorilactobacillus sucicola DSM 21376 = JCM 15457]